MKYKVALIGCGRISYKHIEAYVAEQNIGRIEFVAACDPVESKARERIEQYKKTVTNAEVKYYSDYKKMLAEIPRMLFVGEREEEVEGFFSYGSGTTIDGKVYSYAEELDTLYQGGRKASDMYEIEKSSMHNRVLQYKEATLALFGRGANERLRSYMDLATKLGLDVQSKIYKKVGHRGIYDIRELAEDTTQSLVSISEGNGIPKLDDEGGVPRINPIFQLLRRAKVCPSGDKTDYESISSKFPSLPEEPNKANYQTDIDYEVAKKQYKTDRAKYYTQLETMMEDIDKYILNTRRITPDTNMDRVYDGLTTEEIVRVSLARENDNNLVKSAVYGTVGIPRTGEINDLAQSINKSFKEKNINKDLKTQNQDRIDR